MSITIDRTLAIDLMEQAINLKGADHVQTECYYVVDEQGEAYRGGAHEPKPGCLVGTALFLAAESAVITLAENDMLNGQLIGSNDVLEILEENGVTIEPDALALFERAQEWQDGRGAGYGDNASWGDSLFRALEDTTRA